MRRLMLRDSPRRLQAVSAAIALALACGGCGIKGPLVPAKTPDAAAQKYPTKPPASVTP